MGTDRKSKISKAQQRAVDRYVKKNYDRINVTFHKGEKEKIKKAAGERGESVNAYITESVRRRLSSGD